MPETLNVVAFNLPYPPDYGGAIDVFYKLKALADYGIEIKLHAFVYGRQIDTELRKYCKEIHVYTRRNAFASYSAKWPVMMYSRRSPELLMRLSKTDDPVLFEGMQTVFHINDPLLETHKKFVRMHNVEWAYYKSMSQSTNSVFHKNLWGRESRLLKKSESLLQSAEMLFPIALHETEYYSKIHPNVHYIPAFHPNEKVTSIPGAGEYILYQGNLSVAENVKAVLFLMNEVVPKVKKPFIIAGMNPGSKILEKANRIENLQIAANPDSQTMEDLIRHAHINVLPTFQNTGIKLKLINALYQGRHCIVNSEMTQGTPFAGLCHEALNQENWVELISQLINIPFTQFEIDKRSELLNREFDNTVSAGKLIKQIFGK